MGCEVDLFARYEHQFQAAEMCGVKEPSGVYDRVVDCVGSADAIQKCIELLKPQGKIIGLAVAWDDIQIPGIPAVNKEASYMKPLYLQQEYLEFEYHPRLLLIQLFFLEV